MRGGEEVNKQGRQLFVGGVAPGDVMFSVVFGVTGVEKRPGTYLGRQSWDEGLLASRRRQQAFRSPASSQPSTHPPIQPASSMARDGKMDHWGEGNGR